MSLTRLARRRAPLPRPVQRRARARRPRRAGGRAAGRRAARLSAALVRVAAGDRRARRRFRVLAHDTARARLVEPRARTATTARRAIADDRSRCSTRWGSSARCCSATTGAAGSAGTSRWTTRSARGLRRDRDRRTRGSTPRAMLRDAPAVPLPAADRRAVPRPAAHPERSSRVPARRLGRPRDLRRAPPSRSTPRRTETDAPAPRASTTASSSRARRCAARRPADDPDAAAAGHARPDRHPARRRPGPPRRRRVHDAARGLRALRARGAPGGRRRRSTL